MPTRKPRGYALTRAYRELDMFGHQIGFNIDGEDIHKTTVGATVSLIIFAWCAIVLNFLIQQQIFVTTNHPLTTILHRNHFANNEPLKQQSGFQFAIGLSSLKNYTAD